MTFHDDQARPFTTGQCLRCGMEAIGGICGECLGELADFIDGADRAPLARWAGAWPGGRGARVAAAAVQEAGAIVRQAPPSSAPADRPISLRKARVRFRKATSAGCPGAPGRVRYWREGEIATMWQISARHGEALDPATGLWWTDFDIDFAYIVRPEDVEVLAVLEERPEGGEVSRGHA